MREYFGDKQRKYIFETFLESVFIETLSVLHGGKKLLILIHVGKKKKRPGYFLTISI